MKVALTFPIQLFQMTRCVVLTCRILLHGFRAPLASTVNLSPPQLQCLLLRSPQAGLFKVLHTNFREAPAGNWFPSNFALGSSLYKRQRDRFLALSASSAVVQLFLLVVSAPRLHYHLHKQVCPYEEARGPI